MEGEDLKTELEKLSFDVSLKDSAADADVLKLARLGLASAVGGEHQRLQTASYLTRVCSVCQSLSVCLNGELCTFSDPHRIVSVWISACASFVQVRQRDTAPLFASHTPTLACQTITSSGVTETAGNGVTPSSHCLISMRVDYVNFAFKNHHTQPGPASDEKHTKSEDS